MEHHVICEITPCLLRVEGILHEARLKETFVTVMCKNSVLTTPVDTAIIQVKLAAEMRCPHVLQAFMKPFDVIRSSLS